MTLARFSTLLTLIALLLCLVRAPLASAQTPMRYASIVTEADNLDIIHARQIDEPRFPASLTKVMTLYLVFDALDAGQIGLNEPIKVSARAAATPPVKLGLKAGQTITTEQAIMALSVRSANDVAVVLAERLGGSEAAFAEKMTQKARELGMIKTTFKTASGLPHAEQLTTARDMAKLATAMLNNHRRYYHYFGLTTFTWKGRTFKNHNSLLGTTDGVDGLKTGYTRASGYNLIISAQRDGRRIIAVVLGGASGKSRNQHMADLIERSFETLKRDQQRHMAQLAGAPGGLPEIASATLTRALPKLDATQAPKPVITASAETTPAVTKIVRLRNRHGQMVNVIAQGEPAGLSSLKSVDPVHQRSWSIQIGAFNNEQAARQVAAMALGQNLSGVRAENLQILTKPQGGQVYFRTRFTGFRPDQARAACAALANVTPACLIIAPGA